MQKKDFFIGIDVSKLTLDACVNGSKNHIRVKNTSEGFKQLQSWLKSLQIDVNDPWFVFEYTGGYEYRLVQFLQAKGICFTRVPGLQLKKSMGMQRGKSDKIDSLRIAEYGYEKREKLKEHKACPAAITRLKLLLTQGSGFADAKKAQEHRLKELQAMMDLKAGDTLLKRYKQTIDFTVKLIAKTEAEIIELFSKEEARIKILSSLLPYRALAK